MSLLHGLAERALGAARPVRAQRASPLRALHRDESIAEGLVPASEAHSREAPVPTVAPSHATHPQPQAAATAAREAPTDHAVEAHIAPLVAHRAERDPAPTMRSVPETARRSEAAPPSPRIDAHAPPTAAHADASMPDPEPLVTRTMPQARESAPPRSAHAITPRRERQPARAAAVPAPTEVHVSIGRVELTALPSASPPRAARARDANAHGLSDYLRGSRDRS